MRFMRNRVTPRGLVGAAVALLLASGAISIRRVPEGFVGVSRGTVKPAGWTFRAPWDDMKIIPAQGRLDIPNITVRGLRA